MTLEVFGPEDADEARHRIEDLIGQDPIGLAIEEAVMDFESAL